MSSDAPQLLSDISKPSLSTKPCLAAPSTNGMEHVIPQMIVTPADDIQENNQNAYKTSTSEGQPPEVSSDVFNKNETEDVPAPNIVDQASTIFAEQQPSETRSEETSIMPDREATKSLESVSSSVSQRPLIIESDKSSSHSATHGANAMDSCETSLPELPPVTTMQRPLVFNDIKMKVEIHVNTAEKESTDILVKNDVPETDSALTESKTASEPEEIETLSDFHPPPVHKPQKDNFSYRDLDERDEMMKDSEMPSKIESAEKIPGEHKKKDDKLKEICDITSDKTKTSKELSSSSNASDKKHIKTEKHGIKNLFSSSKSDSSAKDKQVSSNDDQKSHTINSKDNPKESKYNLKKMLDSFKSDSSDPKIKTSDSAMEEFSEMDENANVSKLPHKESKSGIKKFFDSFKHPESKTPSEDVPVPDGDREINIKVPVTIQSIEKKVPENVVNTKTNKEFELHDTSLLPSTDSKEGNKRKPKDSLQKVKTFFDSIVHPDSKVLADASTLNSDMEPSMKVPVTLQSSEESMKQSKFTGSKTPPSEANANIDVTGPIKVSPEKSSKKIESTAKDIKLSDKDKQKDPLHGVKKLFDSFIHPDNNMLSGEASGCDKDDKKVVLPQNIPTPKAPQTVILEKDSKRVNKDAQMSANITENEENVKEKPKQSTTNMKSFFDSFKHEKLDASKDSEKIHSITDKKNKSVKKSHSFRESLLFNQTKKEDTGKELDSSKKNAKTIFDSFKHDSSKTQDESKTVKELKNKELKRSLSWKETLTSSSDGSRGFKTFLDSLTHKKSPTSKEEHIYDVVEKIQIPADQPCQSNAEVLDKKFEDKHKREQSGVKKLFDSFVGKDTPIKQKDAAVDQPHASNSKTVDKKLEDKPKQEQSSMKKLFESFVSKDTVVKPKISEPKKVRMNDNIMFSTDSEYTPGTSQCKIESKSALKHHETVQRVPQVSNDSEYSPGTSQHNVESKSATKHQATVQISREPSDSDYTPGTSQYNIECKSAAKYQESVQKIPQVSSEIVKKNIETGGTSSKIDEPLHIKDAKPHDTKEANISKSLVGTSSKNTVDESSSIKDTKPSLLHSIGDNISALKGKIFQPKTEKKEEVPSDNEIKVGEYDLEIAAKNEQNEGMIGSYRPIKDTDFIEVDLKKENRDKSPIFCKTKNTLPKQSPLMETSPKTIESPQQLSSPDSLYDTCCFKLGILFSNKAIEIISDKGKTPPKKPPKPTPEAIAKARSKVVSQKLKEMKAKGQSIGENIPVGYDGIRFADDETESSCDYKDVDNFDYVMDYELINRYKFENKMDTFTDPSTCSGSYYTADTVTLRSENFSDAPMETVSLGSNDGRFSPTASSTVNMKNKLKQSSQISSMQKPCGKMTSLNDAQKLPCKVKTNKKRVPPPLPPKPVLSPKLKNQRKESDQSEVYTLASECINGLSLSPKLKAKLSKDPAATKSRPLVVAGLKETEFVGLQTKPKDSSKHPKDRKFDMVLKNESLKKINTISSNHKPLKYTKSSPGELSTGETSFIPLRKKSTPERPPLPLTLSRTEEKMTKKSKIPPQIPEKPKREYNATTIVNEKRTVSPPRPVISKIASPPPRPPPPVSGFSPSPQLALQADSLTLSDNKEEKSISPDIKSTITFDVHEETQPSLPDNTFSLHDYENSEQSVTMSPKCSTPICDISDAKHPVIVSSNDFEDFLPLEQHLQNPAVEIAKNLVPKVPPRNRRLRSRTVEITKAERPPEENLRRSQSLSDIDVEKRTSYLSMPEKTDLKHLYTSVNKNGKKSNLNLSHSSSLEKLSGRPLPAPPPPPRKFRSLDRKPKVKKPIDPGQNCNDFVENSIGLVQNSNELVQNSTNLMQNYSDLAQKSSADDMLATERNETVSEMVTGSLQPPARKKKTDNHRFHSLGHDCRFETKALDENSKMARSHSAPLRPGRRLKQANIEYDENANVAFPVQAEVHRCDVILDECGNEISASNIPSDCVDSQNSSVKVTPNPRRKKEKSSKLKSHSSWYDTCPGSEEFEIVDWSAADEAESQLVSKKKSLPTRRQSDPGKGARRTSKFYVDIHSDCGVHSLVDKETSPVRLDLSEKSVQTSLETLSQGMTSRDEKDDDDTDELLDLAQTLQNELKIIINRHKSSSDIGGDSNATNTPIMSGTDSEERSPERELGGNLKKSPSILSSNSELWPLSSSEESDNDVQSGAPVSLTEIAVKRKQKKIFYIAQEIMTSEEVFVDTLKLLNVDFKASIEITNQQKGMNVVPDEVLSQILNHLPQLQHLNENLLMELKDRIENWDKIGKIADVIVKMGPFLKLYSWYIHDFEYNLSLLEDSKKKYPLFAQAVKEFEATPRCKRLALNHYMLKPIQRIPQYRLLLQEYLHHLPEEHVDYHDTVAALQIVSEVATHANDSMKHGDNAQKLISIQNSIMGHKEIIKPGRLFMREGELMKLSRKGMQPRWFVLFNDLLLYLTPVQQGLYRVNHELPLTGMKVAIPIQQDYQNEFSIISVARSFTLASRSPEERQEWIIALTKAIEENASKRSTFTNTRLQQKSQDKALEEDEAEFVLGRKAPVWIPDARVTMCQLCTSEFTVTFRRHHCRACGKVVCSICSSNRISLPYLGNRIARVCDDCHVKLGPGSGTNTESAETDSDNQQIAVKSHLRTEHKHVKKGKRNLPSVLKEVCANDQGSTISGYLQKKVGKSWKRDWFVVKDKVLYEYKASEDVAALKSLPLLGYQIESFSENIAFENMDPSLLFQLTHPGQAPIVFYADTVGSTERWISALKEASVLE